MRDNTKRRFWQLATFRQTFVIINFIAVMFSAGIAIGTATVMLPQLKKTNEILVSDAMASWIYSVQGLGSLPIVLIMPYLNQLKGYKVTFSIYCIPILISYVLQYFASTAVHLLLAAILQGMSIGGNLCIGILGVTEYSEPRFRSLFLVMKSASNFWGIWVANIMGTFFYWRYIPLLAIWPVIFAIISCYFWPDGPYWLASRGRIEECKTSFLWLRGPGKGAEELASIIKAHTTEPKTVQKVRTENLLVRMKKIVVLRDFYMPVFINVAAYCLYFFTGKTVCVVYALVIIKDITQSESWAYIGMLIIDGVTVLGMYIGSYVSMKVSRRSMFLLTSAITIMFLYVLSIYLSLVQYQVIIQNNILSITFLIIYSFAVSWGPMVLSTSFTSELTPTRFKSFVVSAGTLLFFMLKTVSLKFAPILFTNIGMHGAFGVFGTLTLICWLYLYVCLPETSKKTLQELEMYFVTNKNEGDRNETSYPLRTGAQRE